MGLGQSHLSQKIPATTTRCVYLDHLLSRAVNSGKFTTAFSIQQGRFLKFLPFEEEPQKAEDRFLLLSRRSPLSTVETTSKGLWAIGTRRSRTADVSRYAYETLYKTLLP